MNQWKAEVERDGHYFTVRCGDRWEHHLTWDEAVGVTARLIIEGPGCLLRTKEQHDAWERECAEVSKRNETELTIKE